MVITKKQTPAELVLGLVKLSFSRLELLELELELET